MIPKEYQWIIEGWIAPTQFGGILVYLYVESLDHKEWFKWELISITLSEQLKLPNVHFSDIKVDPLEAKPNENVTITMDISNTGGSFAIYNVTLFIDGKIVGSKTVLINPGDVKTVSFTITLKNEGDHTVRLCNKTSIIHVRVNAPVSFEITDLSINPSTVKVGDYVTISVDVKNIGGSSGNYTVTLKVNGKIEDVKA